MSSRLGAGVLLALAMTVSALACQGDSATTGPDGKDPTIRGPTATEPGTSDSSAVDPGVVDPAAADGAGEVDQDRAVFITDGGQRIELVRASPDGVRLLEWAFDRFASAGLDEPDIHRVHFGDETRACDARSGWADVTDRGVEIAICATADDLCRDGTGTALATAAKFCALHELSHGWLIEHATEAVRSAFLDHAGLEVWYAGDETPWHRRGAEYAAEVVAWGLMDKPLRLIRIESPDCDHLEAGFHLLTEARPLVRCDP